MGCHASGYPCQLQLSFDDLADTFLGGSCEPENDEVPSEQSPQSHKAKRASYSELEAVDEITAPGNKGLPGFSEENTFSTLLQLTSPEKRITSRSMTDGTENKATRPLVFAAP